MGGSTTTTHIARFTPISIATDLLQTGLVESVQLRILIPYPLLHRHDELVPIHVIPHHLLAESNACGSSICLTPLSKLLLHLQQGVHEGWKAVSKGSQQKQDFLSVFSKSKVERIADVAILVGVTIAAEETFE